MYAKSTMTKTQTVPVRDKRVARRSPETARKEILDAAAFFLQRRPFRDLTIGELMDHTKVRRPTFYTYFNDVYDLVEALMDEVREEVVGYVSNWRSGSLDRGDALTAVLTETVNLWVRKGPMLAAVINAAAGHPRLEKALIGVMSVYESTIADILRAEAKAGRVRQLDFDETAVAMVRGTQAYLRARLGSGERSDPLKVLNTLQDIWVNALYAR